MSGRSLRVSPRFFAAAPHAVGFLVVSDFFPHPRLEIAELGLDVRKRSGQLLGSALQPAARRIDTRLVQLPPPCTASVP